MPANQQNKKSRKNPTSLIRYKSKKHRNQQIVSGKKNTLKHINQVAGGLFGKKSTIYAASQRPSGAGVSSIEITKKELLNMIYNNDIVENIDSFNTKLAEMRITDEFYYKTKKQKNTLLKNYYVLVYRGNLLLVEKGNVPTDGSEGSGFLAHGDTKESAEIILDKKKTYKDRKFNVYKLHSIFETNIFIKLKEVNDDKKNKFSLSSSNFNKFLNEKFEEKNKSELVNLFTKSESREKASNSEIDSEHESGSGEPGSENESSEEEQADMREGQRPTSEASEPSSSENAAVDAAPAAAAPRRTNSRTKQKKFYKKPNTDVNNGIEIKKLKVVNEAVCENECSENDNCTTYVYATNGPDGQGNNCWLLKDVSNFKTSPDRNVGHAPRPRPI